MKADRSTILVNHLLVLRGKKAEAVADKNWPLVDVLQDSIADTQLEIKREMARQGCPVL